MRSYGGLYRAARHQAGRGGRWMRLTERRHATAGRWRGEEMRAALDASRSAISGERRVAAPMRAARPRLLFVVNSDWFFLSHRLPVARAARAMGFEVLVAAIDTGSAAAIESEGLSFLPLPMSHSG